MLKLKWKKMEKDGDGGANFEILDSFYDKLTEKLQKIKIFDSQILEKLTIDAKITEETLSQDDKNLEIEVTLKKLKMIMKKSKETDKVVTSDKTERKPHRICKFHTTI